ncbi:hypothetical protein [Cerasicoccus fimbriatus]|uniref:hypothetical protein n=1 Tax=Cerasicoccus fimbriatus TaxID=3014554 RepID=UPI0022B5C644|nr:hypothetical protein [Cerasicoccus sp. TK19100]
MLKLLLLQIAIILLMAMPTTQAKTDLKSAEGIRIPLFDEASGDRWAKLEIASIQPTAPKFGPFQLGMMDHLAFDSATFKFSYWPENNALAPKFRRLLSDGGLPELDVRLVRIECERHWSLTLRDARILITPTMCQIHASSGSVLTPNGMTSLSNLSLITQPINGSLHLHHGNRKLLELELPQAQR